jgi:hypothetical protein
MNLTYNEDENKLAMLIAAGEVALEIEPPDELDQVVVIAYMHKGDGHHAVRIRTTIEDTMMLKELVTLATDFQ